MFEPGWSLALPGLLQYYDFNPAVLGLVGFAGTFCGGLGGAKAFGRNHGIRNAFANQVFFHRFGAGHRDGVARAYDLGMEVVEVGRCPVYYLADQTPACRAHTAMVKLSGLYRKPPQISVDPRRRQML